MLKVRPKLCLILGSAKSILSPQWDTVCPHCMKNNGILFEHEILKTKIQLYFVHVHCAFFNTTKHGKVNKHLQCLKGGHPSIVACEIGQMGPMKCLRAKGVKRVRGI